MADENEDDAPTPTAELEDTLVTCCRRVCTALVNAYGAERRQRAWRRLLGRPSASLCNRLNELHTAFQRLSPWLGNTRLPAALRAVAVGLLVQAEEAFGELLADYPRANRWNYACDRYRRPRSTPR